MRSLTYMLVAVAVTSITGCSTPPAPTQTSASYSCPDWSSNPKHNYDNTDFSNFGCAYYNNLAVQVVNPADLQKGTGEEIGNGDRESANVQKYLSDTAQTVTSISTTTSTSSR